MGAALTVVVDLLAIGKQRAPLAVHRREPAEGQEVDDGGHEIVGVQRATGEVHLGDPRHRLADPHRAGGVGGRGGEAAIGGAGPHGDGGQGIVADLAGDLQGRSAADATVGAVILRRDGPLHHDDVLASPLLDGLGLGLLGLVTGGGHDGLRIIDREDVEDDLRHRGAGGPEQRLGAGGAAWNSSQITDGRVSLSRAAATLGIMVAGSDSAAVMAVQNFMKSRRDTPRFSQMDPSRCQIPETASRLQAFVSS